MNQNFIKTGVIGHPVNHSKSPLIHNFWIKKYGLQGEYKTIDISCEKLKEKVYEMVSDNYAGFNVTIPHKISIIQLCDEIDSQAKSVGAVNTVIIKEGKLLGTNSDVFGFLQNIKNHQPNFDFTQGKTLVLGAGGAARAVIQGLIQENVPEILLANRTYSKAEELLNFANKPERITIIPWDKISERMYLQDINLLVNTTALGMTGKENLNISLKYLAKNALVNDIVYSPLITNLLMQAENQGNNIVTGIGMLLHQARPAFHAWYGVMPDISDDLERVILS